jgi:hypothetical protein
MAAERTARAARAGRSLTVTTAATAPSVIARASIFRELDTSPVKALASRSRIGRMTTPILDFTPRRAASSRSCASARSLAAWIASSLSPPPSCSYSATRAATPSAPLANRGPSSPAVRPMTFARAAVRSAGEAILESDSANSGITSPTPRTLPSAFCASMPKRRRASLASWLPPAASPRVRCILSRASVRASPEEPESSAAWRHACNWSVVTPRRVDVSPSSSPASRMSFTNERTPATMAAPPTANPNVPRAEVTFWICASPRASGPESKATPNRAKISRRAAMLFGLGG